MNLLEDLKWRHAAKGMNGTKVSEDKIGRLLEVINLTPTSLGMQAYKVLVIENQELKQRIFDEACPQQPVVGCSHLLVFVTNTDLSDQFMDDYFNRLEQKRNMGKEWMTKYRAKVEGFRAKNSSNEESWLSRQVYIALGFACVAAANERVDSVPIEGYDKSILDKILNLKEKNQSSVVMLPLGYSDPETDWMSKQPKVRKDLKDLVEVIK